MYKASYKRKRISKYRNACSSKSKIIASMCISMHYTYLKWCANSKYVLEVVMCYMHNMIIKQTKRVYIGFSKCKNAILSHMYKRLSSFKGVV